MGRKTKTTRNSVIVFFILILLFAGGFTVIKLTENLPIEKEIYISIEQSSSSGKIVRNLNTKGIFEPHWFFKITTKIYSILSSHRPYAGTYRFTPQNTNLSVLRSIFSGRQLSIVKVTYPEGITLRDFASISAKKLGIDSAEFIDAASSDSLLKMFHINRPNAEGYLMPNTYDFFWGQSPIEIVYRLLEEQQKVWTNHFAEKAKEEGKTRNEILTLASIIEAESPVPEERPKVAGLYYNRLKKGWDLESDPTVQYALGVKHKLHYKDLNVDSPYNTYRNPGLPPGPINSPSTNSISAALNPEKNNFMFFVAVGDGSGRHNFAMNFNQHIRNKAKFKKNIGNIN